MFQKTLFSLALMTTVCANIATAETVYSWREHNVNHYSDIPRGLQMQYANKMSIRTHTVHQATDTKNKEPESLAEKQLEISREIAEKNKDVEKENAKRKEEAAKMKEENCKAAQSNVKLAENARNRDSVLPKYQEDVKRYCN